MISNKVYNFVNKWASICRPSSIKFCDGSKTEFDNITSNLVKNGFLKEIPARENSFYVNSNPSDVARTEKSTFICTKYPNTVGPTNNWRDLSMLNFLENKMTNCMRGRTLYVLPFSMGIQGFEKKCIQLTDSPFVTLSAEIMCRIDQTVLEQDDFVEAVHSVGAPNDTINLKEFDKWYCNDEKYIAHFPEKNLIVSHGSSAGGNSILGKKCVALRLASFDFYKRGDSLAEHMLILCITSPNGTKKYILGAFPSACGKTNLALLQPPEKYAKLGWKIETIGDDIAFIRIKNGKLFCCNAENGFYGVAVGTNQKTNPVATEMISHDTIFTNVGFNATKQDIYWEGLYETDKDDVIYDWQGNITKNLSMTSHPNSRFTCPLVNCKTLALEKEVPIDAIIFGGRMSHTMPLVREARSWNEGIKYGLTLSSEQTSAASDGTVGKPRYDPMAMLPFLGYNISNYVEHWKSFENKVTHLPKIFSVNWFRKNDNKFIWPGYSENMRVLEHIFNRIHEPNDDQVISHRAGLLPKRLNLDGLDCKLEELNRIDEAEWNLKEMNDANFIKSLKL